MAGSPTSAARAATVGSGSAIPFFRDLGIVVPFSANSKSSKEINRGMVYREMYLRLQGQITCTSQNNTPANTQIGDEWGVVKDITLRLNGRDVFKRIDGPALRWLQYYLFGEFPRKALGQIGDSATANPTFDSTLILPFWMPRSANPMDFAFDTSKVSRIDIEITWGNYTDINANASAFTVQPTLDVQVYEVANVGGQFARWNVFPTQDVIAGSTNKYQQKIPVGYMYRSFLIHDSAQEIINVYLESHPTEWLQMPVQVIRDVLGVSRRNSLVPGAFTNTFYLAGATGDDIFHWIYMDFVGHGNNTEAIDSFGLSDLFLEFDTGGATTVTTYPQQLVVPRG